MSYIAHYDCIICSQGLALSVAGGNASAAASAIAQASAAGGSSTTAIAKALASAIAQGGGTAHSVAQAVAQAYDSVSIGS
jgi:hypothetical protein